LIPNHPNGFFLSVMMVAIVLPFAHGIANPDTGQKVRDSQQETAGVRIRIKCHRSELKEIFEYSRFHPAKLGAELRA
jgi:hypothetical protein